MYNILKLKGKEACNIRTCIFGRNENNLVLIITNDTREKVSYLKYRWYNVGQRIRLEIEGSRVRVLQAICKEGKEPWDILQTDFKEEVLGSQLKDPAHQIHMSEKLDLLSKQGKEIYEGYTDDPRNTDNAWLETRVINYHDNDGTVCRNFEFRAGEDVLAVTWMPVSSKRYLHGGHSYFMQLVATAHKAAF